MEGIAERLETTCHEKQQLRQQLRQANSPAVLGQTLARIAHEIRNPLTAIQLLAEELLQQQSKEEKTDIANDILIATHSLNAIISNLLRSVRPAKPHFREIDLAEVLDEVMLFANYAIKEKGIKLEKWHPGHRLLCEGDPEQLKQVMLNLILNAVQAMGDGGKLCIRTERLAVDGRSYIVLKVEDNGCGIPEESQGEIYNPFFTTKERGLGLGLFIVANFLHAHSADIELESIEGVGTTYTVYLPIKQ